MSIFFYCNWHDRDQWLKEIKKKFKKKTIVTLKDKPDFSKIEYAVIWELPNEVYKKLTNLKLIFSMGAGVDHILNLPNYNNVPIVRLKDINMAERMSNHIISQILQYQLNLRTYMESQTKQVWKDFKIPSLNSDLMIGILGVGFLGLYVGKTLHRLGYNIQGYKYSKPIKKYPFSVFYQKKDLKKFIKKSDILVSVLPATPKTYNFINKDFLESMQRKTLLINVGRGLSINERDLINHLKNNKFFFASLDVFKTEPLPIKNPLWHLPNVTITPHVASLTGINSAINHMYKKYLESQKNKRFKNDVNLKKGY